ncbi:uncharacterized protein LOC112456855, partial [Temnothorax curvispinosus]|uniref:Uncharacterized protein LOC112456855 n=1 Tax=Temnothorax curvispinosus TaxID=300111 RepID=A0A6J1Q123_9HYME
NGKLHNARALLDNAATLNFITSDLLNKLDLKPRKVEGRVTGFRGNTTLTTEMVTATVKSKLPKYSESLTFTVIDQITSRIPGNRVDMLLGASVFWSILQQERIQLSDEQPVFQKTSLGWILGGKLMPIGTTPTSRICCTITNGDLNEQLERFWEIERCELERNLTLEEVACEKHFESTTYRNENGRFVVSLPLKGEIKSLGEHNAMKSLKSMERRFAKDPILHQRYLSFLQEYESMGHMELVPENQEDPDVVNYLPHHGVTREESDTTKLRVVFNASCRTSSGISLNNLLMVGPETKPELSNHVLRLRQDDYVLTADIVKMFRQIKIARRDRALLRILWRENIQAPIRTYELTTVTYGTASAAYQAKRCLKQLAIDNAKVYPDAARSIEDDFYMDDWGIGSKSVQRLQRRKQEVIQILASAGMELQKWHSNASELLPSSETEVAIPAGPCKSKRSIFYVIAQIYDPMGLIGPVVVKAKLFMRRLWKLSIDWDDKIPVELMLEWNSYKERLEAMEEIKIPRQVVTREAVHIEMHGFCDASQSAYGACIYLCSIDAKGNRTARLLTSKSRIAPLKILSIPRLTRQDEWRHVRTKSNPADIISRGIDPRELPKSEMWWSGSPWLRASSDQWPNDIIKEIPEELQEKSRGTVLVTVQEDEYNLLERFSSLSKLRRIVAYCYRFVENCRKQASQRRIGSLKVEELTAANTALVKMAQRQAFAQEIWDKGNKGKVSRNSRILSLNPFVDERGVFRVRGRLMNAALSYDQRFPIILPSKHPFSTLLIREMYYKNLHADNGRNFVGAKNELNNLAKFLQSESVKSKILEFTAEQMIEWTFIPPYSPHVGELWEAAVKSAKSHLKAVIRPTSLTFEELTTVFAQIEAILNSRPLTPVSADPSDLTALKPGHFLVGAPLTAIPEPDLDEVPLNRLSRFQLLSSFVQGFWKRWMREYVTQLQSRQKWKETLPNPHLKIGALVLLRDDNAPPLQWRLGRIRFLEDLMD